MTGTKTQRRRRFIVTFDMPTKNDLPWQRSINVPALEEADALRIARGIIGDGTPLGIRREDWRDRDGRRERDRERRTS